MSGQLRAILLAALITFGGATLLQPAAPTQAAAGPEVVALAKAFFGALKARIHDRRVGIAIVNDSRDEHLAAVNRREAVVNWYESQDYLSPEQIAFVEQNFEAVKMGLEDLARRERQIVRHDTRFGPNFVNILREGLKGNAPEILARLGLPPIAANIVGAVIQGERPVTAALNAAITKLTGGDLITPADPPLRALNEQISALEEAAKALKGTSKGKLLAELLGIRTEVGDISLLPQEEQAARLGTLARVIEEFEGSLEEAAKVKEEFLPKYLGPQLERFQRDAKWAAIYSELEALVASLDDDKFNAALLAGIARAGQKHIDELRDLGIDPDTISIEILVELTRALAEAFARGTADPPLIVEAVLENHGIQVPRGTDVLPPAAGDEPASDDEEPGADDEEPGADDEEPGPDLSWIPGVVSGWVADLGGQGVSQAVAVGLVAPAEACLRSQAAAGASQPAAIAACQGQILDPPDEPEEPDDPEEPDEPQPDLSWIPGVVSGWVADLEGQGVEQSVAQQLVAPAEACLETQATNGATQPEAVAACEGQILDPPEPEPDLSWIPAVVESWIQSLVTNDGVTRAKAEELVAPAEACLETEAMAGRTQQEATALCQDKILPPPPPPVTNFAGDYASSDVCPGAFAPFDRRWRVSLTQNGAAVSGTISFHACGAVPGMGMGRVQYTVEGTATGEPSITLQSTGSSGRAGPLGSSAPASPTFTFTPPGPPDPQLAN